jgi:hypothetical protein
MFPAQLFGSQVAELAAKLTGAGAGAPLATRLCNAEIGHFDLTALRDEDVVRRHVPMHRAKHYARWIASFV